jgi:hypothetical protein
MAPLRQLNEDHLLKDGQSYRVWRPPMCARIREASNNGLVTYDPETGDSSAAIRPYVTSIVDCARW